MKVRTVAARAVRPVAEVATRGVVAARTRGWAPASRLFVVGDRGGWSIDDDAAQIAQIARRLGYEVPPASWARHAGRQTVFLPSHFSALQPRWLDSSHRLGLAYLHGRPGTEGHPEFDEALATLRRHVDRVGRVQVTHGEMQQLVVSAGVDPGRVFRIPIGIDIDRFPLGGADAQIAARTVLGVPHDAFVVGSFQKDGVGWGDGREPKRVKGPDVLVAVLSLLRERVPELVVLLTGPARGYVLAELARLGIPHRHVRVDTRDRLAVAYHALDAYLVPARQEGGPKSVLESLATGVPLVATRVGQAPEILEEGRTGLLADVDDVEALAGLLGRVHDDADLGRLLRGAGRATAEAHAYPRLDARWAELLEGFVEDGR
jgi:glycosyltransferase involved in cell wall biosynthesis